MNYLFPALVALLLVACTVKTTKPLAHNVCLGVREVRIHPALAQDWSEPIAWAFERWKQAVPGLSYHILISDEAREETIPCVTSFVPFVFGPPEYDHPVWGDTRNGFVRIANENNPMQLEGRKALILHELGHLLFGFGHTEDRTSIMFHVIQAAPAMSAKDEQDARAAFLIRDGATS